MIDFTRARNCLETMKRYGTHRGEKIGIVTTSFPRLGSQYTEGEVVLFTEEDDKTFTVERPLTKEKIAKQKEEGSLITTIGTTINVPRGYIEEVSI